MSHDGGFATAYVIAEALGSEGATGGAA